MNAGGDFVLFIYMAALDTESERFTMTMLYDGHKNRLLNIAYKILNDQVMAEDAVHNTFVAAIKEKETVFILKDVEFMKWSTTVVKNKCIDILRLTGRLQEVPLDGFDEALHTANDAVEAKVIHKDIYERLIAYIDEMDVVNRQIFILWHVHGTSYQRIADTLGFTLPQITSRIARIKARLKRRAEREMVVYENA